jgi:S-DNA-T family DNA segregation ATPase FtsK/SpoIIIE
MTHWELPSYEQCLEGSELPSFEAQDESKRAAVIEETLESFGAPGKVVEIRRGPTITQFGVEPQYIEMRRGRTRVRVSKIAALADDLALALAAKRIRIQAPVPGKSYVGIEVPNEQTAVVHLRDVIRSQAFQRLQSPLRFALGANVAGEPQAFDLAALPHLLIAGATGSGKSVCVNSIISCFLLFNAPQDVRLLMVDPKRVELSGYNGIPHLLAPVIVEIKQVTRALQWVTQEMDRRYHIFAETGVRNIRDYNQKMKLLAKRLSTEKANQAEPASIAAPLPYWVVIIDELADLMMLAPDETERSITRLAQLARATGIHLILATQRPSVDVVTGVIKANFPARIAFAVASSVDSRVIIDQPGAERLLGSGDMLFQAPDAAAPLRLQGVYVSDREIQRIVQHWRNFPAVQYASNPAERAAAEGEEMASDIPPCRQVLSKPCCPHLPSSMMLKKRIHYWMKP